jgi:hypothetical protein
LPAVAARRDAGCCNQMSTNAKNTARLLLTPNRLVSTDLEGRPVRWRAWVSLYSYMEQGVRRDKSGTNGRTPVTVVLCQLGSWGSPRLFCHPKTALMRQRKQRRSTNIAQYSNYTSAPAPLTHAIAARYKVRCNAYHQLHINSSCTTNTLT